MTSLVFVGDTLLASGSFDGTIRMAEIGDTNTQELFVLSLGHPVRDIQDALTILRVFPRSPPVCRFSLIHDHEAAGLLHVYATTRGRAVWKTDPEVEAKIAGSFYDVPRDRAEAKSATTAAAMPRFRPMAAKHKTRPAEAAWTFLTNHAHVLLLIAQDPEIRLRDVAKHVGISERAVQRIVADLEADAYLERKRFGRRNHYHVNLDRSLRHPVEAHRTVGSLLALVLLDSPGRR